MESARASWVVILSGTVAIGCGLFVGCGDSGSREPGTDAAADSPPADDGAKDSPSDVAPPQDAGRPDADASARDASSDAEDAQDAQIEAPADVAPEAPSDAPPDTDASIPELAPCAISRDVFYVDVEGPQGTVELGAHTFTETNASWYVSLQPELDVMLLSGSSLGAEAQLYTSNDAPPLPGTYPQDSSNTTGPWLSVIIGSTGCGASSGTLTIVDLQYAPTDASSTVPVTSLAMWFDVQCNIDSYRGCVRYAQ